MKAKPLIVVAMAASLLTACEANQGTKQTIGGLGGAVLGGLLGSQIGGGSGRLVAVGAGAVLGGLVGSSIGKSLDETDKLMMERTTQASLEHVQSGQTSTWSNPDSGHQGTVTPTKTYQEPSGQYCREYQQTVTVGNEQQEAYGTACRQPDGSWKIVSS
ncbi:glycine zipper 2TM domain-containing protein [Hwanghaeella grinnelliae]|uniref:17 kDa surface antigen n=1 Tax=Hwanghaeella grinnelliae TaxID=2500179 RepID=A0A437QH17_9PROT|nr:RT0821/Lpp0805 family surface protein [Hwanghaeella grinnelliae]RVU33841.1 glycine zipper 2TM domain-containing protein [Hwanghaeella grinnelliae]